MATLKYDSSTAALVASIASGWGGESVVWGGGLRRPLVGVGLNGEIILPVSQSEAVGRSAQAPMAGRHVRSPQEDQTPITIGRDESCPIDP